MAEHEPILKNNQNTYYPRLIFTPKTGKNSLKHVFRFYCERRCYFSEQRPANKLRSSLCTWSRVSAKGAISVNLPDGRLRIRITREDLLGWEGDAWER